MDADSRVTDIAINPPISGECTYSMSMYLIGRELLISKLVSESVSHSQSDFLRDVLQRQVDACRVFGYAFNGFTASSVR